MNAGTAQKCALNMLSTLIGIRLGHAFDGLMVNVRADNAKLRARAVAIVAEAAAVDGVMPRRPSTKAGGEVKAAILVAAGAGIADASDADRAMPAATCAGRSRELARNTTQGGLNPPTKSLQPETREHHEADDPPFDPKPGAGIRERGHPGAGGRLPSRRRR